MLPHSEKDNGRTQPFIEKIPRKKILQNSLMQIHVFLSVNNMFLSFLVSEL